MAGRPRRTRIYGANYNIGESYYKPTLDNLNRKQFGPINDLKGPEIISENDAPIVQPKSMLRRAVTEEPTFFDFRGRPTKLNTSTLFDDDELDEDVQATLRKIREIKKSNLNVLDDNDIALGINRKKRDLKSGRLIKSINDFDDIEGNENFVSKFISKSSNVEAVQSTSSASLRANATKERLANIESEMSERIDKQNQRERRSANLKKLLSETDLENIKPVKKVTF